MVSTVCCAVPQLLSQVSACHPCLACNLHLTRFLKTCAVKGGWTVKRKYELDYRTYLLNLLTLVTCCHG